MQSSLATLSKCRPDGEYKLRGSVPVDATSLQGNRPGGRREISSLTNRRRISATAGFKISIENAAWGNWRWEAASLQGYFHVGKDASTRSREWEFERRGAEQRSWERGAIANRWMGAVGRRNGYGTSQRVGVDRNTIHRRAVANNVGLLAVRFLLTVGLWRGRTLPPRTPGVYPCRAVTPIHDSRKGAVGAQLQRVLAGQTAGVSPRIKQQ